MPEGTEVPALPEELKGKSPEEIAAFYQQALRVQRDTYETALQAFDDVGNRSTPPKNNPPPKEDKPIKVGDFLTDPERHTRDLINKNSVSREEFLQAAKG